MASFGSALIPSPEFTDDLRQGGGVSMPISSVSNRIAAGDVVLYDARAAASSQQLPQDVLKGTLPHHLAEDFPGF